MKRLLFSFLRLLPALVMAVIYPCQNGFGQTRISPFSGTNSNVDRFRERVVVAETSLRLLPDDIVKLLGITPARNEELERRLAPSLQGIVKNLVLENTRGGKDIAVYMNASPAVVFIATKKGFGSGVIIDEYGHVITNWHVVENSSEVGVVFKPKDTAELRKELAFSASVEKIDQIADLALLRIDKPPQLSDYLRIGDATQLAVGQDVHAIGHPEGAIWTYTKGLISQIRPNYKWTYSDDGTQHSANVIQTQTPIFFGNSGGPLLDDACRIVGITSFGGESQAVSFAVAADEIQRFLLRKGNRITSISRDQHERPSIRPPDKPCRCPEPYDTDGFGRPNVFGCYRESRTPPPDFWLVNTKSMYPPSYLALSSHKGGPINTIVLSPDGRWKTQWHYMDTNCDGLLDLVGHLSYGGASFDSYRRPERELYMNEMASELFDGLKSRIIPYHYLRICQ